MKGTKMSTESAMTLDEFLKLVVHGNQVSIGAPNETYVKERLSDHVVVLRDLRPNRSRSIIRQRYLRYLGRCIARVRIEYSPTEKPNPQHCAEQG